MIDNWRLQTNQIEIQDVQTTQEQLDCCEARIFNQLIPE